ncbi:MAG: O-antigen ligase family protein [Gammaproteobacteria bacterium]|nr:O-antigen ligase family protein [Gammaproteobacteria bacterium]
MPEHIRALFVVLFLSTILFAFAKKTASGIFPHAEFVRRRNLWLVITIVAFLTHNFWIYILITGLLIHFARAREPNPIALFFLLLFAVPANGVDIPGLGLVNYLISLDHVRLLSLLILMPAYLALIGQKQTLSFGRTIPDKFLIIYLALILLLYLRETSVTDTLRQGFYQFTDIFLPYYVTSRFLNNARIFREALLCFVIAAMILSIIGVFEAFKHWLLYDALMQVLEIPNEFTAYGNRAGFQRAAATVGSIPLGFIIAIGIGISPYLQQFIHSKFCWWTGVTLLVLGLLASFARGPWMGAFFILLVLILIGQNPMRSFLKFFVIGIITIPLLIYLPGANKLVEILPFIGSAEQENVSYRERLIDKALIVINRHPFLGSVDYLDTPEMESMRQGQGIIDIVNTYIQITLKSGYIGVSLFIGFFMSICMGIYRRFRQLPDKNSEEYLLGRTLLATLAGILLIIFTVSSIGIIPIVYWSVAGLGAAYINMLDQVRDYQNAGDKCLS